MLNTPSVKSNLISLSNSFASNSRNNQAIAFNRGAIIPQNPSSFWYISSGAVKTVTWDLEGKVTALGYWGAGDVVGLHFSNVEPYEVQCLSPVATKLIPRQYSQDYVTEITRCLRQTDEMLRIVRIERMYHRLWQLLLWLSKKFRAQVPQGIAIDLRITHQELANLIGSTRVTVTRLLNQLETEQKILRPGRCKIIIKN